MKVSDTTQDLLSENTSHYERLSYVKSHNSKKKRYIPKIHTTY